MSRQPRSFLDALPSESGVLENILRHVSARPRSANWHSFVAPRDILTLLAIGGPLTALVRASFTKVSTASVPQPSWLLCPVGATPNARPKPDDTVTRPQPDDSLFRALLTTSELDVDSAALGPMPALTGHPRNWLRVFSARPSPLRKLDLTHCTLRHDVFDHVLMLVGPTLHSLRARAASDANVESIGLRCTSLQSLYLASGPSRVAPRGLWRAVGPTLRSVELGPGWVFTATLFRWVDTHCRELQRVTMRWDRTTREDARLAAAIMLASFGAQLEFAGIGALSAEHVDFVLSACPHAIFDVELEADAYDAVTALRAFGPRLHRASVQMLEREDGNNLAKDIAPRGVTCSSLKAISLHEFAPPDITTVLARTNAQVRSLAVRHAAFSLIASDDVLVAVAQATGALRVFRFEDGTGNLQPNSTSLRAVAAANPMLEVVDLGVDTSHIVETKAGAVYLADVVQAFAALRRLRELVVTALTMKTFDGVYLEAVADACCALRSRGAHVDVFKVPYLA